MKDNFMKDEIEHDWKFTDGPDTSFICPLECTKCGAYFEQDMYSLAPQYGCDSGQKLMKGFFDILDYQECKEYPDDNGEDVYWNPVKVIANDRMIDVLSDMRMNIDLKSRIKEFFDILDSNIDYCISSVRYLKSEEMRIVLMEMKNYSRIA